MRTIYKYKIPRSLNDEQTVLLPAGAIILSIQVQNGALQLWAMINPQEKNQVPHRFYVIGTGQQVPKDLRYITTIQEGYFVWHIFEQEQ